MVESRYISDGGMAECEYPQIKRITTSSNCCLQQTHGIRPEIPNLHMRTFKVFCVLEHNVI